MTSYPNMSYCAYENTVSAMQQICDDLSEALDDHMSLDEYRKARSSRQEAEAFDRIKYMCEDMLRLMENLSYVEEVPNEYIVTDDEMIPA